MASQNDTDLARYVEGKYRGRTGSRERLHSEIGELTYDSSDTERGILTAAERLVTGENYNYREKFKKDNGETANLATKYGLPPAIKGNPLGCGCPEAFLAGATKPVGSHIEADYMCDAGYHNFVYYQLIGFENKSEGQIKVDSSGNLTEDTKTEARELGEF